MLGTMGTRAFLERLYEDDPNGQVANAPQAYDCAVVLSLATAVLDAGDADTLADAAIAVTGDGVTCTTYDDCLDKLEAGDDIDYDGVSGQIALDDNGDPTFARFTTASLEAGIDHRTSRTPTSTSPCCAVSSRRTRSASLNTQIQQALSFLGFYEGPIDGLDSPELTRRHRGVPDLGRPAVHRHLGCSDRRRDARGARRGGRRLGQLDPGGAGPDDRTRVLHRPDRRDLDPGAHRLDQGVPA